MNILEVMKCISKFQNIEPQNNVALFVSQSFSELFPTDKDIDTIKNIAISFANTDPQGTLIKVQAFVGMFQEWYGAQLKASIIEHEHEHDSHTEH